MIGAAYKRKLARCCLLHACLNWCHFLPFGLIHRFFSPAYTTTRCVRSIGPYVQEIPSKLHSIPALPDKYVISHTFLNRITRDSASYLSACSVTVISAITCLRACSLGSTFSPSSFRPSGGRYPISGGASYTASPVSQFA